MITYTKKTKRYNFGIHMIWMVSGTMCLCFLVILIGFAQKILTAGSNPVQVEMTAKDFLNNRPDAKWLKLTDVDLFYSGAIVMPFSSEILLEAKAHGTRDGNTHFLVSIKDPETIALWQEYRRKAIANEDDWSLLLSDLYSKLNENGTLEGVVRHGFDEFATDRHKLSKKMPDLIDDFVIIDLGVKPGIAAISPVYLYPVIFLVSLMIFLLVGLLRNRHRTKLPPPLLTPPPLPRNVIPPPLPQSDIG